MLPDLLMKGKLQLILFSVDRREDRVPEREGCLSFNSGMKLLLGQGRSGSHLVHSEGAQTMEACVLDPTPLYVIQQYDSQLENQD